MERGAEVKARLYLSRNIHPKYGREYLVVCLGVVVGMICRTRKRDWSAFADLPNDCVDAHGFRRRGDAKRFVVQNQGMVV